jgi:hypothetical protein
MPITGRMLFAAKGIVIWVRLSAMASKFDYAAVNAVKFVGGASTAVFTTGSKKINRASGANIGISCQIGSNLSPK